MNATHETQVLKMGTARNPIHMAACSCGWESSNLHTRRRGAVDDARDHRHDEERAVAKGCRDACR